VPFEGCLPIEELARRSEGAMRFGPLRPVGLSERAGGKPLYAVAQLRREDTLDSAFSLVGFQTRLKQGAQKEAFGLIPGLENARFIRFGRMHRNNYICAPRHLDATLQLRRHPHVFFAGQITGLEGYIAAMATGLVAGMNVVGPRFKAGEMFVPEVLMSAKAMAAGVELVKSVLAVNGRVNIVSRGFKNIFQQSPRREGVFDDQ